MNLSFIGALVGLGCFVSIGLFAIGYGVYAAIEAWCNRGRK